MLRFVFLFRYLFFEHLIIIIIILILTVLLRLKLLLLLLIITIITRAVPFRLRLSVRPALNDTLITEHGRVITLTSKTREPSVVQPSRHVYRRF